MMNMIGGLLLMMLLPVLYIVSIIVMYYVMKWLFIFIGVVTGDKSVIDEFDCRDKESWSWNKMVDDVLPPQDQDHHVSWRGKRNSDDTL